MASVGKFRGLREPKITPITKDQYQKFHMVRKLNSPALGIYLLLSWDHKKFIGKQLGIGQNFKTARNLTVPIYHYHDKTNNLFIFPLTGEPLFNLIRQRPGQEIRSWIQKCGGEEEALFDLVKFGVKLYMEQGIDDLLMECFRICQDQVIYTYDSWAKKSQSIVLENPLEIESYFFCEAELQGLREGANNSPQSLSFADFLFKLGLMMLNVGVPEVKIRNYEYCQLTLNRSNIEQKLRLFKIKYCRKNLGQIIDQFLSNSIKTMEDLWAIMDFKIRFPNSISDQHSRSMKKSLTKSLVDKQNVTHLGSKKKQHKIQKDNLNQSMNASLTGPHRQNPKVRLKSRILSQSVHNIENTNIQQRKNTPVQSIDLKALLSKIKQHSSCMQLVDYLGLSEYVPKSTYEDTIINLFSQIRIKGQWQHRAYPNGSVYWGELQDQKRNGKGLYLFDSHDLYYGDWVENSMHGTGVYIFKSGQSYKGELEKGLKQGFGSFFYKDGKIFEGNWVSNNKMGLGTVSFPSGVKFTGFFSKNNHTEGLFTKIDEKDVLQCSGILQNYNWETDQFISETDSTKQKKTKLKKCKVDAFCNCVNQKGQKYAGECENELPNGFGIKQTSTEVYEGMWSNGKEEGNGTLTLKNKFTVNGIWKDGLMLQYFLQ